MDCSTGEGQESLANAAHYLAISKIFSLQIWPTLSSALKRKEELITALRNYCLSPRWSDSFIACNKHECKTASEFLLNPWVLIQLPWDTTLLHQWLVAIEAEILQLSKEFEEFHVWSIPEPVNSEVKKLYLIIGDLRGRVTRGFVLIDWMEKQWPQVDGRANKCILDCIVLPALSPLEFILSQKALDVTKALKVLTFKNSVSCSDKGFVFRVVELEDEESNLYHSGFRDLESKSLLGCVENNLEEIIESLENFKPTLTQLECSEYHKLILLASSPLLGNEDSIDTLELVWKEKSSSLKDFVHDIQKRMIKSNENLEDLIPWDDKTFTLRMSRHFLTFFGLKEKVFGIKDKCVLYNVLNLQAKREISTVETKVALGLCLKLKDKVNLSFKYEDPEASKMTCNDVSKTLNVVKEKLWTRTQLSELVATQLRNPTSQTSEAPVWLGDCKQIYQHFEVIIYFKLHEIIVSHIFFLLY
jgi:hypothetical protein